MTLPRPQRELLLQLVFRWPHPCFVVRSRYGHYALVVSAMSRSRPLERMDRGYSSETVDGLATAGLITVTWVGEVPAFGFRRPFDGVHGSRIEITPSGRAAINAVSEAQQRRAQAISEARVRDAVAISEARAARVARGEVSGDARPVSVPMVCPDGGACHHECAPVSCFRVGSCGPLSGVYPGDRWPASVVARGDDQG